MPRSSKLEPEVQALVNQAERARLAIEALVDVVEPKHSTGVAIETHGDGRIGRCNHERFNCAGQGPLWRTDADDGWCSTAEAAANALIKALAVVIESAKTGGDIQPALKLVWRKTPEVRSITTEIGDLFNANCRLSVVPADWIVSFPEDIDAPMDKVTDEEAARFAQTLEPASSGAEIEETEDPSDVKISPGYDLDVPPQGDVLFRIRRGFAHPDRAALLSRGFVPESAIEDGIVLLTDIAGWVQDSNRLGWQRPNEHRL